MRIGLFENPPCEESRQYVLSVGEGNIELFPQLFSAPHFQKFIKTAAYKKLVELYSTVVGIHKSNIKKKLRELDMDLNSQETDNIATGKSRTESFRPKMIKATMVTCTILRPQ